MGIPSENFNAYWVGNLSVPYSGLYNILINKSHANARVIIDKHIIIEKGQHNEQQKVYIPEGKHLIEVEYLNHWHTTDMKVVISDLSQVKQPQDPTAFLKRVKKDNPNVVGLYAGVYESNQQSVVINIPKMNMPIVLFLSSYESVNWQINNPYNTLIAGVVYGSSNKGSIVQGVDDNIIINRGQSLGGYKKGLDCSCAGGQVFHCNGRGLAANIKSLQQQYTIDIIEAIGDYSTDYLSFSNSNLYIDYISLAEQNQQEFEQQKQACLEQGHPNFESIYD